LSETATRRAHYLIALAIVAMVVVSSVALTRPPQPILSSSSSKTIQVTGTGTVSAAPDEALLTLAVESEASTATLATQENAISMTSVLKALGAIGVGNDSIQTISYSLNPVYSNPVNQSVAPTIIGYDVVNTIQVTLNGIQSVGNVLDQAVSAGVNHVQEITFTLSTTTMTNLQKQAVQLALQDAQAQATATAATLGVTLIGPVSVTPSYVFQPVSYNRFNGAIPQAQTPIQGGTLEVTATVSVTYDFS